MLDQTNTIDSAAPRRRPTADEAVGMAWWNRLSSRQRADWLQRARSARPADAWAVYKRSACEAPPPFQPAIGRHDDRLVVR